jgi:hypothetical protein
MWHSEFILQESPASINGASSPYIMNEAMCMSRLDTTNEMADYITAPIVPDTCHLAFRNQDEEQWVVPTNEIPY